MLVLTRASLATIDELFRYKEQGLRLDEFPGYTPDQWGIKAHNRPWIEEAGDFAKGQKIIEVGGGYSLLPKYLAEKYQLEAWVGDDFGISSGEPLWSRWGNAFELPSKYPSVKYVFQRFGESQSMYPAAYFDRIFSVSTLEHISVDHRVAVLQDMHRCLRPGGREFHTIDIASMAPTECLKAALAVKLAGGLPIIGPMIRKHVSEIGLWIEIIRSSGVKIGASIPNPMQLLDQRILVESADVVYRFYPPNDSPKAYSPSASLLLIIDDR